MHKKGISKQDSSEGKRIIAQLSYASTYFDNRMTVQVGYCSGEIRRDRLEAIAYQGAENDAGADRVRNGT